MTKHISIHLAFGLIIGITFSHYFTLTLAVSWLLLTLAFSVLLVTYFISKHLFNPRYYFAVATFLMFLAIGASRFTFAQEPPLKNHYTHFIKQENALVLSINQVLKPSKNYLKYEAEVQQVNQQATRGKLLLNIKKDSLETPLKVGDFVFTNALISEVEGAKNPFQFDYKSYLAQNQIYNQIFASPVEVRLLNLKSHSVKVIASNIRDKIIYEFEKKGLKGNELAVVKALLLGERHELDADLRQSYAAAGAIHILAISGLHIGIIMLLISFVLKPLESLKNGKTIKLILLVLILWCYAIIAGLSSSVVRATSMFTAIGFGLFINRKTAILNTLALSALILLLLNPLYLFDVGFKMSYLAVLAIVLIQPKIVNIWHPKFKVVHYFWQLLTVSTAAQLGVLPLSLYYFHQFPGLFFLTNMVILPFLGTILGLGLLFMLLAYIGFLPAIFIAIYQFIILVLNQFIVFIAHQEAFLLKNISFSLLLMLTCYLVIISAFYWMSQKTFYRTILVCLSVLSLQSVLIYQKYQSAKTNEFIVFNNYKTPLIALKNGVDLKILRTSDRLDNAVLTNFKIGSQITNFEVLKTNQNLFLINDKKVLVVDKSAVFEPIKQIDIVVLTESPKLNLERLILQQKPKLIIADGSNYKSLITLWQRTCSQLKISFYNTSQKGAFIYYF
ncbi:MAG: competence protein [Flavobacteriales bacterium CG_4_8_14_3_um_filter_35_10]|nr:MAG: competence protein [Flavobacteriales bacterium CG_4_8_14_3_um_filter_35_10]